MNTFPKPNDNAIQSNSRARWEARREKANTKRRAMVEAMHPSYVASLIRRGSTLRARDIPEGLVSLKRAILTVKRGLRDTRQSRSLSANA